MALSLLSVIGLLVWWQRLLSHNLEVQYSYIQSQLRGNSVVSEEFYDLVLAQDEKIARRFFIPGKPIRVKPGAVAYTAERLQNRQRMVMYEQFFFILLLLSGQLFFLYIFARERVRRKQIEETILLATHELRQPLQSLSLALETLRPRAKGRTQTAITNGLTEISKLGQHIRFLAEAFSQPAAIKHTQITDAGSFVSQALSADFDAQQLARVQIDAANRGRVTVKMSEPLIRFVLRNLVENALKYSTRQVNVTVKHEAKRLSIEVCSAGETMPAGEFRKIGSIFQRSSSASVQNTPGFGLGLYLCGRIVRRASGKLQLSQAANGLVTAHVELKTL